MDTSTQKQGKRYIMYITASVSDASGNPLPGYSVKFVVSDGSNILETGVAETEIDGTATYSPKKKFKPGTYTIYAYAGGSYDIKKVTI